MDAHAAETANRQGDVESGPQIIQPQNVFTATGSSSKVVHNMPNQTYEGHRSNSFHAWSGRNGSTRRGNELATAFNSPQRSTRHDYCVFGIDRLAD
ncbi:hypothetical protein T11_4587 [Trichinella zimbabwensis]|uniref:Uncharacterized protein n=1 Tax=Trichinella zimbabwensis TaxID=268475 RepID=A0A0V1GI56_9BILA|nr:hypothetical protein T11_4587 [Trichinella zimbabwensis]